MKLKSILAHFRTKPEWYNLSPSSKRIFEQGLGYVADLLELDADTQFTRQTIINYRNDTYEQRGRCRLGIQVLQRLFSYAYDNGLCKHNPAANVKNLPKKVGHAMWTLKEVEMVMASSPVHVRRAIMLALYTGQRRSDLVSMRWDNYDGDFIHIIQIKTKKPLSIPIHRAMKLELDAMRKDRTTPCENILTTNHGWEWAKGSLTMAVSREANKCGVDKPLHGIRKTTASLLAELGCSPHEIAAITGQSLKEVMNYTRHADQRKMAQRAVDRWTNS